MSPPPHRFLWFLTAIVVIGLGSLAVSGQDAAQGELPPVGPPDPPVQPEEAPTAKAGNVSDRGDLEAFFDGAVNVQLEAKHIAGAVVTVVVGDKMVFTKGYGYADVEARRKVDPEKTLFRIGSITKLFTYTAVMQQVEEGKLDLDADVNRYLTDVTIPATFEQPITLKHLLTHTPGFEDHIIGLFAHQPEDRPLAEVLREQMPKRVRPPGLIASYSNHGTAIAGHAVACVSGLSWEDYVEQRILKPLGMEHTLARQPAEDRLPADMSKGYKWEQGQFAAKGFEYIPIAPAGCIGMTGADAARFMRAHLNDGRLGKEHILKPETARRMREPLFRHHPKTSAMCYGFMEERRNGQRIVGHGGATLYFHSLMELIPERRVGVFMSFNTDTGAAAHVEVFNAFLRRYFPAPDPERLTAASGFRERVSRLTGEYVMTRYSHSSLSKLSALFGVLKVSANDDDTITISTGDNSRRFVEVEPFVFRELDGPRRIVFQEGENGGVLYLFPADAAPVSAQRREWYETSMVHWGLLWGSIAIFASALLYWPAIAFSVRGLPAPHIRRTRTSALLSWLAWILSAASIAFGIGLAFVLKDPSQIVFGLTPPLKVLVALTPVCAVLAVLTVLGSIIAWRYRYWRVSGRLHYTLVALAGIAFTWFLYDWNLLTFGGFGN
jgi:CubicO group peptidase (beta-lactamase class C family)